MKIGTLSHALFEALQWAVVWPTGFILQREAQFGANSPGRFLLRPRAIYPELYAAPSCNPMVVFLMRPRNAGIDPITRPPATIRPQTAIGPGFVATIRADMSSLQWVLIYENKDLGAVFENHEKARTRVHSNSQTQSSEGHLSARDAP